MLSLWCQTKSKNVEIWLHDAFWKGESDYNAHFEY